jgi:Tol biopolymer transport system component
VRSARRVLAEVATWLAAAACGPGAPGRGAPTADSAAVAPAPTDAVLGAVWSRDGKRLAVAWLRRDRSRLYGLFGPTPDGSMPAPTRGIPLTSGEARDPSWSPDGLWIVFATRRDGNGEVYRVRPDGTGPENLTRSPSDEGQPAYSPDGKLIVLTSDRDAGASHLFIMGADGSRLRPVGEDLPGTRQRDPAWSPDGERIAFAAEGSAGTVVYVVTLATGAMERVGPGAEPSWSADGRRVFFARHDTVFSWAPGGAGPPAEVVTPARSPTASPDGRWLAFVRGTTPEGALFILDLGTRAETRITP